VVGFMKDSSLSGGLRPWRLWHNDAVQVAGGVHSIT
jgi:hypothetical protein